MEQLQIKIDITKSKTPHPFNETVFSAQIYINDKWYKEVGGASTVDDLYNSVYHSLNEDDEWKELI
tara:strand:- start:1236 stop:1433 length:198 start_codon:yes stop_codon:yes gene_type:complete